MMTRGQWISIAKGAGLAVATALAVWAAVQPPEPSPAPVPAPSPAPKPAPPDDCPDGRCPLRRPKPWGPRYEARSGLTAAEPGKPVIGGKVSPDGAEEVMVDLPAAQKKKNVGGRDGAGLCVFTSIEYCGRWQNDRPLFEFQKSMRAEPGGGYPEKVDAMLKKYAPGTRYVQDTSGNLAVLKAALASGRAAGVTYGGYDPHYRGYVAHMVMLAHLSDRWAAISDNNFPGDDQHVWMSPAEFERRWKMGGGGWSVVLLAPPPPPPPTN